MAGEGSQGTSFGDVRPGRFIRRAFRHQSILNAHGYAAVNTGNDRVNSEKGDLLFSGTLADWGFPTPDGVLEGN